MVCVDFQSIILKISKFFTAIILISQCVTLSNGKRTNIIFEQDHFHTPFLQTLYHDGEQKNKMRVIAKE